MVQSGAKRSRLHLWGVAERSEAPANELSVEWNQLSHPNRRGGYQPPATPDFRKHPVERIRPVGAANMSRLTWFTLCAITWFTPSVVGVYQKVSSFKCVNTFVNVNPPYAEFSKNQGNLSLGTGFTHSDFFSTKSLT